MIVSMEKELAAYYRQIDKTLTCPAEAKTKILNSLKSDVEDFIEQNPKATIVMIVEHFGEPSLFAGEYVVSLDKETVHKQVSKSKMIKRTLVIAVASLLFIGIIVGIIITIKNSKEAGTYYSEEVSITTQLGD